MSSPLEIDHLVIPLIDGYTILDVGCGWGKWGHLVRTSWYRTVKGKGDTLPALLIGVDLSLLSLKRVKFHNLYDDVVMCTASHIPFRNDSFDVVLALELLEHLPKDEGKLLLNEVERVSRETVIISTPNNPAYRGGTMGPEGFNPYDAHVSRWGIKDFRSRNYRILGSGFCLHGKSIPILKSIFSPISYFFPNFAVYFVAIKKHSGNPTLGKILRRMYPI